jgi:hypothetical protein
MVIVESDTDRREQVCVLVIEYTMYLHIAELFCLIADVYRPVALL